MVDYVKLNEEGEKPKKFKGFPRIKEIRLIPEKGFPKRRFSWKNVFLMFLFFFLISSIFESISYSMASKVAVINIDGIITSEKQGLSTNSITPDEINSYVDLILSDNTYKLVILDINSPGGSPVATSEISNMIEKIKAKNITVYSYIHDIGASGGYWISTSADKIYANEMSLVGSIGVTSASLGFENFIKDYNITYRKLTAGKYKDMGTPFREQTDEEEELFQNLLDEIHKNFITYVSTKRNMSYEKVEKLATGEIFLGSKAKELGLIDETIFFNTLKDRVKEELGEDILFEEFGPEKSFFEELGINSINLKIPSLEKNNLLLQ